MLILIVMRKIILNILIVILIALPFGLLVYYFGGFKTSNNNKTVVNTDCSDVLYFGIMKPPTRISFSPQDNYLYYSYGITKQPSISLPVVN